MKTVYAFTFGVISTLLAATYLMPAQSTTTYTTTVDETVHVQQIITTIDLDNLRDVSHIDKNLDRQLASECTYAIQRQTDEPLQGIIYYLHRYWNDDACAAYEHLQLHDWY